MIFRKDLEGRVGESVNGGIWEEGRLLRRGGEGRV